MKSKFLIGIFMVLVFGLTACSLDINISTDDKKPDVIDNGDSQDQDQDQGQDKDQDKEDDKQYENEVFKEVTVSKSNGKATVKGKARVFEGVFQYAVISGTEILLEDHYQTDGAPAWGDFEITIDSELMAKENVSIELFVYSAKDGSKTDSLTIPLK
ncbi:Gmad2 immunoglobulin-like domain-containing protein [Neobacillus sp. CF12]|uniref:Gmad2 immunoglobulin-like domain-containing protein n=1 Tax=Neobacillus sp. CF12 TaxID=3055864 RepID=UPI0025A2E9C2|nr:Gmad2 immunoglobulin-like domain-containing protein [Neobacillus sp. CF12]MDM5329316.1 Gmad2 immunoglobulin-like domain-containing protein [Neobacillus sp. CF12]